MASRRGVSFLNTAISAERERALTRSRPLPPTADLVELINWSGVEVLNITADRSYENALKKGYRDDPGLFIESDCDEQILIHVPFTQQVKVSLCEGSFRSFLPIH